ncbi:MAG: hypothetical protein ABIW38_03410 [Ferruginibacter sp.]
MEIQLIIFGLYLFLAVFLAGNMTTLQFQHYGIYHFVARDNFKNYMAANNKSALVPSILPALILLITNIVLIFFRPDFFSLAEVLFCFALNLVALISTFVWQRKLQSQMALEGYNDNKINKLISTNYIRTIIFLIQAIIAITIVLNALSKIKSR